MFGDSTDSFRQKTTIYQFVLLNNLNAMFHRIFFLASMLLCWSAATFAQKQKTVLTAEIYDYSREMIYIDCVQSPLFNQEFHTNPGEIHEFAFETAEPLTLLINGNTKVLMEPGDSLHVKMRYDKKAVGSMEFSGTPAAVANNRFYWELDRLKRGMKYRPQLLSCIVLDVKPKDRLADSHTLLARLNERLQASEGSLTATAVDYMRAETEAAAYNSLMEYPVMYAETRKLPVDQQEIGDYWSLMDGYTLSSKDTWLRCPDYVSMLMRYCFYQSEKQARAQGATYEMPRKMEDMYAAFSGFAGYTPEQRDAVLYTLLCNFIRNGREIERAEALLDSYKTTYNRKKAYLDVLNHLLQ